MSGEKLAIHKRKVEAISEMVKNAYDNSKPHYTSGNEQNTIMAHKII